MKNLLYIYILIFLSTITGCSNKKIQSEIEGIWCLEKSINKQYVNDDDFFGDTSPLLFDFQNSKTLTIKNIGYKDTTAEYSFLGDSVLKIYNKEHRIIRLNENDLVIEYPMPADTLLYYFKRSKDAVISTSVDSIKSILLANRWSVENPSKNPKYSWLSDFEFFDNNVVMFRYKMENNEDNLQQESWDIAQYAGKFFFVLDADIVKNRGNIDLIYQIIHVTPDSIDLWDHYSNQLITFKNKGFDKELFESKKKSLTGTWVSYNDTTKAYWKHISEKHLATGRQKKFIGNLTYVISDTKDIKILINETEIIKGKWKLSKDCKMLLVDYDVGSELGYGEKIYTDYSDIFKIDTNELNVKLYNYVVHENMDEAMIYLNILQDFKKIK